MAATTLSILLFCALFVPALARNIAGGGTTPGSSVSLLFINTTALPFTAYIERSDVGGQTTYLVNCADPNASGCTVHDATLSVVQGLTYDFHTAVNTGGALTIHCTFESDGKTPKQCTKTVAGGPYGTEISASDPTMKQWSYLPVKIIAAPASNPYQLSGSAAASIAGATVSIASTKSTTSTSTKQTTAASAMSSTSPTHSATTSSSISRAGSSAALASSPAPASTSGPNSADSTMPTRVRLGVALIAFVSTQIFFVSL